MHFKFCKISELQDEKMNLAYELLSAEQREYIDRINPLKRNQSLAVRTLLFNMLEEFYPYISLSKLSFKESGVPFLCGESLYVSLTHSGDLVGCAIGASPIGIDIQTKRDISDKLIKRVCTSDEEEYMNSYGKDCFFIFWALKECFVKANGCSFSQASKISFVKDKKICSDFGKIDFGEKNNAVWAVLSK